MPSARVLQAGRPHPSPPELEGRGPGADPNLLLPDRSAPACSYLHHHVPVMQLGHAAVDHLPNLLLSARKSSMIKRISQNNISPKEVSRQFLEASPHRSFFPPESISMLIHRQKPKRSHPHVSLREETSGKTQADTASQLRVQHLQRLAAWASGEAGVGPIGALLGHRLATDAEAAGIPIGASTFLCQRCESVLQPGFNCTIRIKSNKKKAKRCKRLNSGQNSVVYACHFCGDQNLIRRSGKGIVKGLLSSRKPASMDMTSIMLKGESMNMATVATKKGIDHSLTAVSQLESYRLKTSTLEKDKHGNGPKSNLPEDFKIVKGAAFPMMDHGQLAAATVQEDIPRRIEVESTTHGKCMNEIEPVSYITSQEEFLVGSNFVTPQKSKLAEVTAPKGSAEPLKTRSTLKNKGQSCVSVTGKAPRSSSKSASNTKSAPSDSTRPAGSSRKRTRKGWTTLKQIAEKDELERKEKMDNFVIPFFVQ